MKLVVKILAAVAVLFALIPAFLSMNGVAFDNEEIPSVIMSKVADNEKLLQYGTNADNSLFFVETKNKETGDVFVRMWKDGVMIVNEQK